MMKNGNGSPKAEYMKAVNRNGQTVIIHIDTEGEMVTVDKNDLTVARTTEVSKIPYSIKMSSMECSEGATCGVALECENGVCTISRNNRTLEATESNFVYVKSREDKVLSFNGEYIAYPIILLSEIRANNEMVVKNTDIVTRKLRNNAYRMCRDDLNQLATSLSQTNTLVNSLMVKQQEIAGKLGKSIQELESLNEKYVVDPPQNADNKRKYELVQNNIRIRNELMPEFLRICKDVALKRSDVMRMNEFFQDTLRSMESEFGNVDKVIE